MAANALQRIRDFDRARPNIPGEHWLALGGGVAMWLGTRRHPALLVRLLGSVAGSALVIRAVNCQQRTVEQDPAFGLQQILDVALKALSPGINDPTTACMCIDQLSALLARLASRHMPKPQRMAQGRLRVIAPAPDFATMLALTIDPIVQHSRGDIQVLERLLDAVAIIAGATRDIERRHQVDRTCRVIYRELQRVEPPLRSVLLRRRARMFMRSLRQGVVPAR